MSLSSSVDWASLAHRLIDPTQKNQENLAEQLEKALNQGNSLTRYELSVLQSLNDFPRDSRIGACFRPFIFSIDSQESRDFATLCNNVGCILQALGRWEEALNIKTKALEIGKETFGESHPTIAIFYNNIACTLKTLGLHEEALEMETKAREIKKKLNT